MVAQFGIDPPVGDLHLILHGSLIAGFAAAGRYYCEAIVVGQVFHEPVQVGFVPVRLDHRSFQVVGDQYLGGSPQVVQTTGERV